MKKILSLILVGVLSLSLFAIGASADTIEHDTKTTVVGSENGVTPDNWNSATDSSSDINVKVDKITHKYAVDITFNLKDLTLGNIEWDVNDMKYKFTTGDFDANKTQTIKLENRSDLAVYAYATVAPTEHATKSGLNITADKTSAQKLEIAKATAATAGETKGTATEGILNITLAASTDKSWSDIADYFANLKITEENLKDLAALTGSGNNVEATYKIATITVTLSKSAD